MSAVEGCSFVWSDDRSPFAPSRQCAKVCQSVSDSENVVYRFETSGVVFHFMLYIVAVVLGHRFRVHACRNQALVPWYVS